MRKQKNNFITTKMPEENGNLKLAEEELKAATEELDAASAKLDEEIAKPEV